MIWKPKERQLTREEAIELAQKELKPFWFGTKPLLAGARSGAKAAAHPLESEIQSSPWLLNFIDAGSFAGQDALQVISNWHKRYAQLGLKFLMILRFPFPGLFNQFSIEERFEQELASGMRIAVDYDGSLSAAFGFSGLCCKSVALVNGKAHAEMKEPSWAFETEVLVQKLLRQNDPGLPLPRAIGDKPDRVKDHSGVDFGSAAGSTTRSQKLKVTDASGAKSESLNPGKVIAIGEWVREADRMSTSDPKAALLFRSPAPVFAVLAQPHERSGASRMAIEINGMPVYEEFFGPAMSLDDDGLTQVPMESGWFYQPLRRLPEKFREITLKFPDSGKAKTVLFAIRFGE